MIEVPDKSKFVVATAAHCLADKNLERDVYGKYLVQANRRDLSKSVLEEGGVEFVIVRGYVNPRFNQNAGGAPINDVALFELKPTAATAQNVGNLKYISMDMQNLSNNGTAASNSTNKKGGKLNKWWS